MQKVMSQDPDAAARVLTMFLSGKLRGSPGEIVPYSGPDFIREAKTQATQSIPTRRVVIGAPPFGAPGYATHVPLKEGALSGVYDAPKNYIDPILDEVPSRTKPLRWMVPYNAARSMGQVEDARQRLLEELMAEQGIE